MDLLASGNLASDRPNVTLEPGQRYVLNLYGPSGFTWPDFANNLANGALTALGLRVESIGIYGNRLQITILT